MAFAAQIRDPDTHKFTTPSGKIEIYSMAMAAKPDPYGLGAMPPIPTWFEPVEPDAKYPLMLCSPKSRARTHSIHGNQPLLARVDPDDVWMNPADARARGITDGQTVRIFNDRGSTLLPVKVTPRIAQGVVSIKEGAWFTPDADGADTSGLRQRAGGGSVGAVRRDDVQYESRRGRGGRVIEEGHEPRARRSGQDEDEPSSNRSQRQRTSLVGAPPTGARYRAGRGYTGLRRALADGGPPPGVQGRRAVPDRRSVYRAAVEWV